MMLQRSHGDHRDFRRLVVIVVVLLALLTVPVVSAHANLVDSSPAQGEQVEEPPDELVLEFSEGVQLADVTVESADGDRLDGEARIDRDDRAVVHVPLEEMDDGTYVVQWEVLSVDGHTTSGSFFFVVGDEPPSREQLLSTYGDGGDYSVSFAELAFRTAYLGGTIVLVGAPITLLFVVYPPMRRYEIDVEAADRTTRRLFGGVLPVVLLAATGLAYLQSPLQHSLSVGALQEFLATDLGLTWFVRAAIVLLLGLATVGRVGQRVRISKRAWFGTLVGGGLLLQVTIGWTSHSAAVVDGLAGVVADVGHLVGAALWLGGLAALATIAPTYLVRAADPGSVAAHVIRRFSVLAVTGVTLAGATGLAIAAWHVPSVESLGETLYGTALAGKTALVLLAVGLGGVNRFVLHRQLQPAADRSTDRTQVRAGPASFLTAVSDLLPSGGRTVRAFVRSVRIELVLLVVVLVLSGLLTSIPTAANVTTMDDETTAHVFESDVDGVDLTVRVVPGHVGPNVFDVQLTENGTAVDTDEPVTLVLRNPDRDVTLPGAELDRIDEGNHSTVEPIPSAGTWEVRVTTWIDGTYVSERYMLNVTAPGIRETSHPQTEQGIANGTFGQVLRYGAVGFAVVGGVAVGVELRQLRKRQRER